MLLLAALRVRAFAASASAVVLACLGCAILVHAAAGVCRHIPACALPPPFWRQAVAEQYFPKLETPSGMALEVEDAHGNVYTLRWR